MPLWGPYLNVTSLQCSTTVYTGGQKKNNTETNQNDTDTNDSFGANFILCKDIK